MRRSASLLAALLVAIPACGSISQPGVPTSLAFDSLPSPAVVLGDTLRDDAGNPAPLRARVFDGRGSEMPDAAVEFLLLDSGARITPEGYVIADSTLRTGIRVVASIDGLQSVPRTLTVTRRPDSLAAASDTNQVIEYDLLSLSPVNSAPLSVRVLHRDAGSEDLPVQGWRVRYAATGAAPGDTIPGHLVNEQSRLSLVDTTDANGTAARLYRLVPARLTQATDTIEVTASAQHLGEPLAGSPVRFHLILRPRPAS